MEDEEDLQSFKEELIYEDEINEASEAVAFEDYIQVESSSYSTNNVSYKGRKICNTRCLLCKKSRLKHGVTLHRFPRDKDYQAAWLELIGQPDHHIKGYERLCNEHFTEDSFKYGGKLRLF